MIPATKQRIKDVEMLIARAKFNEQNVELVRRNFGDDPELIAMAKERAERALINANAGYYRLSIGIVSNMQ